MVSAVARPTRFEHYRWLGDKRTQVVHDLDNAVDACALDDLVSSEKGVVFGPDLVTEARNRGYRPCPHCAPAESEHD